MRSVGCALVFLCLTSLVSAYIGEVRLFAGNTLPPGWVLCDGGPLPASLQFELSYFPDYLPNLAQRVVVAPDYLRYEPNTNNLQNRVAMPISLFQFIGETGGNECESLTASHLPAHSHTLYACSDSANSTSPLSANLGSALYYDNTTPPTVQVDSTATSYEGKSKKHTTNKPNQADTCF
jgi:microcystin-dependent protein